MLECYIHVVTSISNGIFHFDCKKDKKNNTLYIKEIKKANVRNKGERKREERVTALHFRCLLSASVKKKGGKKKT